MMKMIPKIWKEIYKAVTTSARDSAVRRAHSKTSDLSRTVK